MLGTKSNWTAFRYFKYSIAAVAVSFAYYHSVVDISQDLFLDTPEFITKYGYPAESHEVQSEDGYLTTVHRIPHGRYNTTRGKGPRPAVFLQHGIMCSSDVWVYSGPEHDLPFILADKGFDVWLGNSRGNCYADKHSNDSLNKEKYWDFSWHEMGYYDLPAIIDYILAETNQKDIIYIGHSMGTTMFFVMASTRPEYNAKVNMMVALAPVAVVQNFTTVTQNILVPAFLYLGKAMKAIDRYQLLPRATFRSYLVNLVCKDNMPTQFICRQIAFGMAGDSYDQHNSTSLAVIMSHIPAGSSDNQVLHFCNNIDKARFLQRDFGVEENLRRYNQKDPPEYDLSKVTAPVVVYYSENDALAPAKTVQELARELPNVVKMHKVPLDTFNHFDFTWGIGKTRLLYDDLVSELEGKMIRSGRWK